MPKSQSQPVTRKIVASNLLYARTLLGWSQEELADRAGMHRTQVGQIERATSGVSVDSLTMLAKATGLPPHVLLMPSVHAHPLILEALGNK